MTYVSSIRQQDRFPRWIAAQILLERDVIGLLAGNVALVTLLVLLEISRLSGVGATRIERHVETNRLDAAKNCFSMADLLKIYVLHQVSKHSRIYAEDTAIRSSG